MPRSSSFEYSILQLKADGLSIPAISTQLNISISTVCRRLRQLRRKFDVTTTSAAIDAAAKRGVVTKPKPKRTPSFNLLRPLNPKDLRVARLLASQTPIAVIATTTSVKKSAVRSRLYRMRRKYEDVQTLEELKQALAVTFNSQ